MQSLVKYAKISRSVTQPFVESGDRHGRPVIFLHGVTDSHRSFSRLMPLLPRSIRAVAVTQRGHGNASKPETGYSPLNLAADVDRFMHAVGIGRAVIVGHSMGSYVAQKVAIEFPERVEKLVLIGSFPRLRGNLAIAEFVEESIPQLEDPIDPAFVREFQESTVERAVPGDFIDMAVEESLKVPARVWKAAFAGLLEDDHSDELCKVEAETLLIWGERDAFFGHADQVKLLRSIKNTTLNIYPGTGHSPHWEQPERVAADIAEFLGVKTAAKMRVLEPV